MTTGSPRDGAMAQAENREAWQQGDIAGLARDLVEKVGIEGAIRYCRSLGWGGVLDQVEQLRHSH